MTNMTNLKATNVINVTEGEYGLEIRFVSGVSTRLQIKENGSWEGDTASLGFCVNGTVNTDTDYSLGSLISIENESYKLVKAFNNNVALVKVD